MTEILGDFLDRLEACGIEYMLVGSVACGLYGQARATQDVDLVVKASDQQLLELERGLPEDRYYLSEQAMRSRQTFNVIDLRTGTKVDLMFLKARPFSLSEFARRQRLTWEGRERFVASAEDVILAKLEWNRLSPSDRQLRDAWGVIQTQGERLDRDYLERWAEELQVLEQLRELLS